MSRYHDVSEMPPPPRAGPQDLTRRIRSLWRRIQAFCPPVVPRGVQRFRDIEEAQAAREASERQRPHP